MQSLPPEVRGRIFSQLNLNEQVKCRLANRVFKELIDGHLKAISHLRILLVYDSTRPLKEESYLHEKYLSEPFVEAIVEIRVYDNTFYDNIDRNFISFVSKFCPNLKVFDAKRFTTSLEDLLPVAKNLIFFRLRRIVLAEQFDSFKQFDNLESFELEKEDEVSLKLYTLLAKKLLEENKPIPVLKKPSLETIDKETFKEMSINRILSITYDEQPEKMHPISAFLAKNLLDLSINFIPRSGFCQGPLPLLKYVKIDRKYDEDSTEDEFCSDFFFTSPQLRFFSFKGKISTNLLVELFQHFDSLKHPHLKIVYFRLRHLHEREVIKLPLPQQLESLTLGTFDNFELTNTFSESLRSFEFRHLAKLKFNFPNLRELKISITEDSLVSDLLSSLSKCTKLRALRLSWALGHSFKDEDVQSTIDLMKGMTQLKTVDYYMYAMDTDQSVPLVLKQENIPSVETLYWDMGRTEFYPIDVFSTIEFNGTVQGLDLKYSKNDVHFLFYDQRRTTLLFTQDMDNLEKLELECSSKNLNICSDISKWDWTKLTQLKSLSIRFSRSLNHENLNSLIEMMAKMKHLKTVRFYDWRFSKEDFVAEREPVVLKQENIASVTKFFWKVNIKLTFHPIDIFDSLLIQEDIVLLENRNEKVHFMFEEQQLVTVSFKSQMKQMTQVSILTTRLDRQFVNELKYLKKVKRLRIGSHLWNTSKFKMILLRRLFQIYLSFRPRQVNS